MYANIGACELRTERPSLLQKPFLLILSKFLISVGIEVKDCRIWLCAIGPRDSKLMCLCTLQDHLPSRSQTGFDIW